MMLISSSFLAGYLMTYVLLLATPGPNTLATGGFAALHGFTATLPFAMGIGRGAAVQAVVLFVGAGLLPGGESWEVIGRSLSAFLLATMGWRILKTAKRLCADTSSPAKVPAGRRADLAVGFGTSSTNPMTGMFFAAQFIGPAGDLPWLPALVLILATAALALTNSLAVAAVFSHAFIRRRMASALPVWSRLVAGLFAVLAFISVMPMVETLLSR